LACSANLVAELLGGAAAAGVFRTLVLSADKPTTSAPAEQAELELAGTPGH